MTVSSLGDSALLITLGERVDAARVDQVRAIVAALQHHRLAGVVDVVGAFASVAVFYDRARSAGVAELISTLENVVRHTHAETGAVTSRRVELPVCYGGAFGPDLKAVGQHVRLASSEVIARHSGADYRVHAVGFAPGFPYLGGLPPSLSTPRRASPRPRVPAGSVGIGGTQTGVYPFETPGGWNLIGRTPLRLFDLQRAEPALMRVGDAVTFRAIDEAEFARLQQESQRTLLGTLSSRSAEAPVGEPGPGGIEVLRPGMLTTIQDLGRSGYRSDGVPMAGAADPFALRVANLLVGNSEDAAALEFTLVGPELRFSRDAAVAFAGADFGFPRWTPIQIRAGDRLRIDAARTGCRGYLAIAGGIEVLPVLGSRSTYLRAKFGGYEGRALRVGDRLPVPAVQRDFRTHWRIDERILPHYSARAEVRVLPGKHADAMRDAWEGVSFEVTPQCDRMGIRLRGDEPLRLQVAELISIPVAPGTIQVPPDGKPIVLLADAQTIGGYPQLGHVISVDLPVTAQLRPGDRVRFRVVDLAEAHRLLLARERALGMLREGLAQKLA